MKLCKHKGKQNISPYLGTEPHYYCKACGWHLYKNKEYTKKEWEEYINKSWQEDK
ncbi:MAG: hypothetical protein JXN64_06395 [Spirochaetes bacterium]|nr:hypothetical protein [Spirochaetota bacterium]